MSDAILAELTRTANRGGTVADLSRPAYQWLYDQNVYEMPYGTARARDGDPDEWLDEHALPDYADKP